MPQSHNADQTLASSLTQHHTQTSYPLVGYLTVYSVLHTVQINFHAVDINKYRYIQTPIGLLIFEVVGHVYPVQCEVLYNSKLYVFDLKLSHLFQQSSVIFDSH